MRTYHVTLTGISPLLLHHDDITFQDELKLWRTDPDNKKNSVPGDDRSPAFTWLGCLYHDDGLLTIPSENIMKCLTEAGAMVPVPGGKNGKTFKAQTQSGMCTVESGWPILVKGDSIPFAEMLKLRKEKVFTKHVQAVQEFGFSLFMKRAQIGTNKHVRVRPKFAQWTVAGQMDVWDEQITKEILVSLFKKAGEFKGLGDWRPSSQTPGPYGRFKAEIEEV